MFLLALLGLDPAQKPGKMWLCVFIQVANRSIAIMYFTHFQWALYKRCAGSRTSQHKSKSIYLFDVYWASKPFPSINLELAKHNPATLPAALRALKRGS